MFIKATNMFIKPIRFHDDYIDEYIELLEACIDKGHLYSYVNSVGRVRLNTYEQTKFLPSGYNMYPSGNDWSAFSKLQFRYRLHTTEVTSILSVTLPIKEGKD